MGPGRSGKTEASYPNLSRYPAPHLLLTRISPRCPVPSIFGRYTQFIRGIPLPVTCVSEGPDMPGILLEIVIGAVTAVLAAMLIDIARTINGRSASRRTARH